MFGTHDLALFVISGLLLNITPGVDFLYVLGRSSQHGFKAGVWASLGIGAGCLIHIFGAALGLSAILATSATAFLIIKWIGAAYLIYIGIAMLLARETTTAALSINDEPAEASVSRIFWQGFLTNALNPKVALFFLAFVPQFIDAGSQTKIMAFLFLGFVFNINGTIWNIFVAWMATRLLQQLSRASTVGAWINRLLGAFFVGLGIRLALSEHNQI